CRLCHDDRLIQYADPTGTWHAGSIAQARTALRPVAEAQTMVEVRKTGQPRAKRQCVTVALSACPIRITYATNVRRPGPGTTITQTVWLVEVRLLDTNLEPWLLLTDWQVTTAAEAVRICPMDRHRRGVEDSVTCTKDGLG